MRANHGSATVLAIALCVGTTLTSGSSTVAASTADAVPDKVNWAEHVAPLVHEKCAQCHRPGDIAPMSLLTYDEARPWAKSIAKATGNHEMPPWDAAPGIGAFANDRTLADHEIALFKRWAKQGARPGDLDQAPPPPPLDLSWRLGEPDVVVRLDQVALTGGGPDVFRDLIGDQAFDQDRWLRAVEIKPGNRRVVHHVILYSGDDGQPSSSGWLGAWAAGMDPMVFPAGTAKLLEAGHQIVADMHYHPADTPEVDSTEIGLYFYDGEPDKELINLWVQNATFRIPAGAADHVVRSSFTFPQDSTIYGLLPHMHYRGKEFTYTATFPDGRQQTLLHVPGYDFNWQTVYQLSEPLVVPRGTRLDCEAHFDNSAGNLDNPDPTRDVTFGNESFDEMMIGFVDYVVNDGQRPASAEQKIERILHTLAGEHPTATWLVQVGANGTSLETVLHLPMEGDGSWFIPMNGQVVEGQLTDIGLDNGALSAQLRSPMGILHVSGNVAEDTIEGQVSVGDETFEFRGSRYHN